VCTLAASPGEVLAQETVPTAGPDETLESIAQVLAGWRGRFDALGIASFGPLDLDRASAGYGSIATTPKPGWRNVDVLGRLAAPFDVPAVIDTDVNGAAQAEMRWGAGRGLSDFAYVTVGTGVGVGLIVNGAATRGFQHCELGHVRIARLAGDGFAGACPFHAACVEGLASAPAIRARTGRDPASLADDDPAWETAAHALAQLCHAIVCAAAPRRIAIGGAVAAARAFLLPRIEGLLRESLGGYLALPDAPYVVPPDLGDAAGPLGAVALALEAAGPGA
jgi:fructokinase